MTRTTYGRTVYAPFAPHRVVNGDVERNTSEDALVWAFWVNAEVRLESGRTGYVRRAEHYEVTGVTMLTVVDDHGTYVSANAERVELIAVDVPEYRLAAAV